MRNLVKEKRVVIGALGVGLAAMLSIGVALGVGQRGDGPPTTWLSGVIGDGSHGTIGPGQLLGPGRYAVPFDDWPHLFRDGRGEGLVGEGKALVFTVPPGLRLEAWLEDTAGCDVPPCPGPYLLLKGEEGFLFELSLETADELGRGYLFNRSLGEPIDEYGYPLRCGGRAGCRANDDRPAKYDPLIDRVVASARIASAPWSY